MKSVKENLYLAMLSLVRKESTGSAGFLELLVKASAIILTLGGSLTMSVMPLP